MYREKKIIRASWWAIVGNGLLAVLKLTVGFISGSFAVIADGIDSTTDIASSVVVLLAARIISRPPNLKFPYGYKKADTVATKVLSFVIFFAGAQLAYSTIKILVEGSVMQTPSVLAIWVTVISILGKLGLTLILYRTGRKVESPMLIANAKNLDTKVWFHNDFLNIFYTYGIWCTMLYIWFFVKIYRDNKSYIKQNIFIFIFYSSMVITAIMNGFYYYFPVFLLYLFFLMIKGEKQLI